MPLVSILLLLAGCGGAPAPTPEPAPAATAPGRPEAPPADETPYREVDVAWLAAHRDEVPILIDVRTEDEYASGHVPGALNIPMHEVASRMEEIEAHKDGDVYLICQSGRRSAHVAEQLAALGFKTVNVAGGTSAWIDAGNPVE